MGGFKRNMYSLLVRIFNIMPLKKAICILIRKTGIPNDKFYKDLKFKGRFKVKINGKRHFYLYHHGGTIENEIFWKGLFVTWENDTGWLWKQLCACSDVVFDIGANTGVYSLIAKSINPDVRIYAFEPAKKTITKLQLNNKINHFDIHCEEFALSNISGKQIFYDIKNQENQTSASLSADKNKNWELFKGEIDEYDVKTMTVSDYIEMNNITKIDLVKMDIEMHEPEAIEGFGQYLNLYRPVVFIEVLTEKAAEKLNKLIGSDFIRIHLNDRDNADVFPEFKVVPGKWNYVFFHKDIQEKIQKHTTLKY